MMPRTFFIVLTFCLALASRAMPPEPFELRDGDRVAIIGDAFAEREQAWSYLETLLITRWPDRDIRFRNLGWSGDTVQGLARAMFDKAPQGMERLLKAVDDVKPTLLFVCYGMAESFDGEAGLPAFREGYGQLLDKLQKPGVRIVLISPIKHEKLPPPLPDPAGHNASLKLYVEAIKKIAEERGHRFVDLFDTLTEGAPTWVEHPLTENGIHLNQYGYWLAAGAIERGLGLPPRGWTIDVDFERQEAKGRGVQLSDVMFADKALTFRIVRDPLPSSALPMPFVIHRLGRNPGASEYGFLPGGERFLRINNVGGREVTIKGDGPLKLLHISESKAVVCPIPNSGQTEELRHAAIAKNVQFFNQYRPANWTYIFGFRKHEQGQNAVEMPRFDEPITEIEKRIAELRVGRESTFKITLGDASDKK